MKIELKSICKALLSIWEKYDISFLSAVIRQICPSDKRFISDFLHQPDDKEVLGPKNRSFLVNAKDIKVILNGLTYSPQVLSKVLLLFRER